MFSGINLLSYTIEDKPDHILSPTKEKPKHFIKHYRSNLRIKLILENNNFCFDNIHHKQIKGTAMGSKFAPVHATLTIGYLEEKMYTEIKNVFGTDFGNCFEKNWKRFLDDCFIPWTKTVQELRTLHEILNNLHKDISFTIQFSNVDQSFLDVLVQKDAQKPITSTKIRTASNTCYFILANQDTLFNIPYNLAHRIRTIVSEEHVLKYRMQELKSFLLKQKYPEQIINHGLEKAMALDKDHLRTVQERTEESIIPYVSTYNPNDPEMFHVIIDNEPI